MFPPTLVEIWGTENGEGTGDMLTGYIPMVVGRQTWSESTQWGG